MTVDLVADETKRDSKGRRITPKARREELLKEYAQSGLTQYAFARRAGVNYPTFASWVQGQRESAAVAPRTRELIVPQKQVQFTEVNLPASTPHALSPNVGALSVILPDGLVVRGDAPESLAALVKALRS